MTTSLSEPAMTEPWALVSVHDLMPETMPAVRRTIAMLERHRVEPVTLLVVPGGGWTQDGIAELKALEASGYQLAGHGWRHRVDQIRGLRHRLHSLLLSRNVAEHLALDADGIARLMRRCRDWFSASGLAAPELYVPPAWALGSISRTELREDSTFRLLETFTGVLEIPSGRERSSPVLGYEADAPIRVPILRTWNALGRRRAASGGVVRIGIHPFDIDYPLQPDLLQDLKRYRCYGGYGDALTAAGEPGDTAQHRADAKT
jgi:predicted deacetylase